MAIHKSIAEIVSIFEENSNRYTCHELAKPILEKLSFDKDFFDKIIQENLSKKSFLQRERHYSTLSLDVFENPYFTMMINVFPALPDKNTDITFQSIHHHGSLLLSTVGFFGEGYGSILYKKGFEIDAKTQQTNLEIQEIYQNSNHQVKFIDAYQPHVVFYPKSFSATLVIWCEKEQRTKDNFKKIPLIAKFKKPLGKFIRYIGLEKIAGISKIENFDFYRENSYYFALKDRKGYSQKCSNANFLQNIFAFLQQFDFSNDQFIELLKSDPNFPSSSLNIINDFLTKKTIDEHFCESHLNISQVNLHRKDLMEGN